ncbi:hypothetical protein C8R43DRAFT_1132800 [Mycena crocata]|nr:hypothetical protein C8R43DRAFT_1132800 [Mycena crocata]
MNVHEEHYFHVYTHVLDHDLVYTFHTRYVGQYDSPPDLSFHPIITREATIVLEAGEGCRFFMDVNGRMAYWLLVPPFTSTGSERAVRFRVDGSHTGGNWPSVEDFDQAVYTMQDGELLCLSYLARQDTSLSPPRPEYVLNALLSGALIRRGSMLVAPAAWRGRAKVLERIVDDGTSSILECELADGRTVWVKAWNQDIFMDVGRNFFELCPLVMGRLTFGTMLAEERTCYLEYGIPTSLPSIDPCRKLARSIAKEEYDSQSVHARWQMFGRSRSHSPSIEGSSVVSSSPTISSAILERFRPVPYSSPTISRVDFRGRPLLEVVTADFVQLLSSFTIMRHAVVDPSEPESLRRDQCVLIVGAIHMPVRFVKNHGSTLEHPLCSVIECVSEGGAIRTPVILLAANFLVHASFTVEEEPNAGYVGTVRGANIFDLGNLADIDHVIGVAVTYYQATEGLGGAVQIQEADNRAHLSNM